MARACATKRSLSSWTSYKKGLVDSGKSCGVLVVSPLIALMHTYAVLFTQTSSVKPNPFTNVTIKIDVIFTFKLNACANSVYQAFPPRLKAGYEASEMHTSKMFPFALTSTNEQVIAAECTWCWHCAGSQTICLGIFVSLSTIYTYALWCLSCTV